ncbi:MAG TPA: uroporphyrinogen-III synthase [Acidobacteriaceae bacterium]|nr:uroporphyrinogen-III synthase [Acidobacteriaceae bacterium]
MREANFKGLRVLALETRRSAEIEELVRNYGGEPLVVPAVREIRLESQEHAFLFAGSLMRGEYDLVIFLTDPGVRTLIEVLRPHYDLEAFLAALRKVKIASRGPKPAAALAEYRIPIAVTAPEPYTWRELMGEIQREFGDRLARMRIAVQEYAASNPEFLLSLAERSLSVTRVPLYEWALPEDVQPLRECVLGIARKYVDIVLFTTAVQVLHLFQVATGMGCVDSMRAGLQSSVILSIGPSTSEELRRHGLAPDFEPAHPKIRSLLQEAGQHVPELLEKKKAGSSASLVRSIPGLPSRSTRVTLHRTLNAQDLRIGRPVDPASRAGMEFLHEIGSRMAAADPFHAVLDRIVEFVSTIIPCDSCFIYVLEQDQLVLRASRNPHENLIDHLAVQIGQGITGWVAEHRQPVSIPAEALRDPRFKMFRDLPEDLFEAMLAVPIQTAGKVVGVINLQHRRPYQHTPDQVRLLTMIGFLVGAEVERARLDTENLQLSERLETRRAIDKAKAILQRDMGLDEQGAYHALQRESRDRRKSMREIADAVIMTDDLRRKLLPQPSRPQER